MLSCDLCAGDDSVRGEPAAAAGGNTVYLDVRPPQVCVCESNYV